MKALLSCESNMDTACVERKYSDGTMTAIDTIAVKNEVASNMYQRSELDSYLANIDKRAEEMYHRLIVEMAQWQGVTEKLKAE